MKRNKFSLSHFKLATFNMGELVPVATFPVYPGDSIQQATSALIRTTPLNAPVMHPVHVRIHHWFVPHRLVWDDSGGANTGFQAFITGGPAGTSTPTAPTITPNTGVGYAVGTLSDYLGIPTGVDDLPHSALPHRGYALIWNEFYRDQDLHTALTIDKTDGADTTTSVDLQKVCWEKDYFTTARPWTQKGTEVTLPLGTTAPVISNSAVPTFSGTGAGISNDTLNWENTGDFMTLNGITTAATQPLIFGNQSGLVANLTGATAASVNTIREAFALQRYKEARARYGSRYTEYLRYLGVKSSDARLQRPEYLGGGKNTLQFSEVLQQAPSTSGTPGTGVGILKGHGIGAVRSNRYRRFFEEHGYVYTLMSVLPKTIYATGLPKHFSLATKEDYWQKELERIGQEEVLNKELYWADTGPNDVFGYQDRYDWLRRVESSISGEFRSAAANFWHYARIFAGDVTLNSSFVAADPTDRVYQSTTPSELNVMAMHSIQARRLLSRKADPLTF